MAESGPRAPRRSEDRSAFPHRPCRLISIGDETFLARMLVAAPAQASSRSTIRWSPLDHPPSYRTRWHAGSVSPAQLRRVRTTYWGFDGRAHSGSLDLARRLRPGDRSGLSQAVRRALPDPAVETCRRLWRQRPPVDGGPTTPLASTAASSPARGAGRRMPTGGRLTSTPSRTPTCPVAGCSLPTGRVYLDRTRVRPGMAVSGGVLVQAFASAGWPWGGRAGHAGLPALFSLRRLTLLGGLGRPAR